ncbi:MAG: SufS family cysteine desulfurase [Bacteroidota bacterium]
MVHKNDFPIFQAHPNLVYLDSAATTQKPQTVIDAITKFYSQENASINRGLYKLGAQVTRRYTEVREKVAQFIQAKEAREIVFTSGTTDGINLVAHSFLLPQLESGDEVLISTMEHHANLIPWQQVCKATGAKLKTIPISEDGELDQKAFSSLLNVRTKMLGIVHISNTLGTINPVQALIAEAHEKGIPVLVDAAQSAAHYPLNVQELDADFLVFSGHKVFGPTGTGILYGKAAHLEKMEPIRFGGDMINRVQFAETSFADFPKRFEAGTTNIAGVIGLGAALDYIKSLDRDEIIKYLADLRDYALQALEGIDGLKIVGQAREKSALHSFVLQDVHPHDIATFLGADNIAIRAGNHCTQPLMDAWGLPGTVRASFSIYNTRADIDRLVESLKNIQSFFG